MKFTDGFKIANQMALRWTGYPGLFQWYQCNSKGTYKWKRESGGREPERW